MVAANATLQYNSIVTFPSLLIQRRRLKRQRTNPARVSGLGLSGLISLVAAIGFFIAGGFYLWVIRDLPALDAIPALIQDAQGNLWPPTAFYDRSGTILLHTLQHPGASGRQYLSANPGDANSIPFPLIEATLSAIQPDFWTSPGYDWQIWTGEVHATLAQLMVHDLLLHTEPAGLRRNLRERLLAGQLTQEYGHSVVLEWFLNSRRYGELVFGADAAARAYFGTPASEISFAQAAWLTALAEMPGIDPGNPPMRLADRQQEILKAMQDQGRLSPTQADQALQEQITVQPLPADPGVAPELIKLAREQVEASLGSERVARGGLRILTTLDDHLQTQAACTLNAQIERLENRAGQSEGECQADRLLPSLALETPTPSASVTGAAMILDVQNGQILAMVGDSLTPRPSGSLLAPFVYLAAFSRGYTPASLVWDVPGAGESSSTPALAYQGPLRLRTALANSYSGPLEQLLTQLGSQSIRQITAEFGLSDEAATFALNQGRTQARPTLEGGGSTLLDTAHAFSILANSGVASGQNLPTRERSDTLAPTAILMVFDTNGQQLLDWSLPTIQPVVSSALAYLVNHILSDETARWPSLGHPNPLEIGRPAAAHIGYTADDAIGWTIGYTPYLTHAVWLATSEDGQAEGGLSALPEAAAGIWHALMQYTSQAYPPDNWSMPPGVSTMKVCAASGLLPSSACPAVASEVFLTGSEPIQVDNLYRSFQVNRDNDLLATVFTPPELIEERTFMVVPPEALEWARQSGLPLPPESYDIIANQSINPNARILSPGIFDHVQGILQVRGSATGSDFKYYRIQIGQGLNPQSWIQIGSDVTQPVSNGVLGEWDTRSLEGLYAIQLLVVGANQKLETAVTQVTIDNQDPQVSLRVEESEGASDGIVLHAQASDNLELVRVELYVNDIQVGSITRAPFSLYWEGSPGSHQARAVAYDLAGNTSTAVITFTLK